MEDEKVIKQREANRRSYEKHKAERLAKRKLVSDEEKEARRLYLKQYRENNRERLLEHDRKRWQQRRDKQNSQQRLKRQARSKKEQSRLDAEAYYRKRYGITLLEYDRKLVDQRGRCAICLQPQSKNRLHIDHDHACCPNRSGRICGKCVRGLLCGACNMIVGLVENDPKFIQRLTNYLKQGDHNGSA